MSSVAQRLMTAEEYEQSPQHTKHSELVRGEVVEAMPPGLEHGMIAGKLALLLGTWAERSASGHVVVEAGYILRHDPDTVRAPDVSYVRAGRITPGNVPPGFGGLAPDLAVEIVSPSETAEEIREKVRDFLTAGTPLVWVIYPRTGEVVAHTADGLARTYSGDDLLEFPDVLPGFSCRVGELFE